ncbi:MAG: hypothetical protein DMG89_15625 [Acidobacteria bacterium]|nr:MAG: hypothetical protein DMG89_15625 [Acidobacteriota bacterium]
MKPYPLSEPGPSKRFMKLGEVLCKKYALTSFRNGGCSLAILAINEALEAAAMIAEEQKQIDVAACNSQPQVVWDADE